MNEELIFVCADPLNRASFDELCQAHGVAVYGVTTTAHVPDNGDLPIVYDLTQMLLDERDRITGLLRRRRPTRATGVYQTHLDDWTIQSMQRNGVVVSDKLDDRLLDVVPSIKARKKKAA